MGILGECRYILTRERERERERYYTSGIERFSRDEALRAFGILLPVNIINSSQLISTMKFWMTGPRPLHPKPSGLPVFNICTSEA